MRKNVFSAILAVAGLGLLAIPALAAGDGASSGSLPMIIGVGAAAVAVIAVVAVCVAASKKKAAKNAAKTGSKPEAAPIEKPEPAAPAAAEPVAEEVKAEEVVAEEAEDNSGFDVEAADQTIEESKVVNEAPPVDVESDDAESEAPEMHYEAPAKLESVEVTEEQPAMEVIELDTVETVGEEAAEDVHIVVEDAIVVETDEKVEESVPVAAESPIAVELGEPDPVVETAEEAPAELKEGEFRDAETGCIYTFNDKGIPVPPEGMVIRYKWSFLGRLIYADDVIKYRYMMLRRLLLSYKKVRSSVSWNFDSYFLGRKPIAKIRVRGKNITVYFNIDPSELAGTKYAGTDVSKVARYKAVPFAYRITGERKLNYALELIKRVMEDTPCAEPEYIKPGQAKYAIPYKELGELLSEGYLKIGGFLAVNRASAVDDDEDEDDNIAVEADADDDAAPDISDDVEPIPAEDFRYNPKKGEA